MKFKNNFYLIGNFISFLPSSKFLSWRLLTLIGLLLPSAKAALFARMERWMLRRLTSITRVRDILKIYSRPSSMHAGDTLWAFLHLISFSRGQFLLWCGICWPSCMEILIGMQGWRQVTMKINLWKIIHSHHAFEKFMDSCQLFCFPLRRNTQSVGDLQN